MISSMIRKKCGLLLSGMAMLGRGEPHYAWFGTSPKTEAVTSKKWTECKDQTCCDVAVIGGGSGGISFAFEASKLGLQTVLFDYVKESSHGTRWGIGGTCVNVGCIPKKLIHQATIHGEAIKNSKDYGWELGINSEEEAPKLVQKFSWEKLITKITSYIRSLNFGYKTNLEKGGVKYINALATLVDANTILCSRDPTIIHEYLASEKLPTTEVKDGQQPPFMLIKANKIVIATGTRPSYLSEDKCKNSKLGITSDDIFWMKRKPGKTLVVGGGYVAVEIAGFLAELGFKVTMMTRGHYLRSFDRDMVEFLLKDLKHRGVNIVPSSLPISLQKESDGTITAQIKSNDTKQVSVDKFDTVLFAVGRNATTSDLNVKRLGLNVNPDNGKLLTDKQTKYQTSIPNIYALGDVVDGLPQLTGTVQKAAVLLARKLAVDQGKIKMGKRDYSQLVMDYKDYPTTIFTPLEYSVCGLSEQTAKATFPDGIEVYHSKLVPLEQAILDKYDEDGNDLKQRAYMKVICDSKGNVLGMHYAGPNAGEVMQGYAVAMRQGLTYKTLTRTVGIHPTVSEEFTNLKITKSSGQNPEKQGC